VRATNSVKRDSTGPFSAIPLTTGM
jgi:hypothetical protein